LLSRNFSISPEASFKIGVLCFRSPWLHQSSMEYTFIIGKEKKSFESHHYCLLIQSFSSLLYLSICISATCYFNLWYGILNADRRRLEKFLNVEAMMPMPLDPERFSFWVCLTYFINTYGVCPWFHCSFWFSFSMQLATLTDRRPCERLDLLRMRDTTEVQYLLSTLKLGVHSTT
jgi:hypothetical protein